MNYTANKKKDPSRDFLLVGCIIYTFLSFSPSFSCFFSLFPSHNRVGRNLSIYDKYHAYQVKARGIRGCVVTFYGCDVSERSRWKKACVSECQYFLRQEGHSSKRKVPNVQRYTIWLHTANRNIRDLMAILVALIKLADHPWISD